MDKSPRQFELGVVHTAKSLPLIHTVHLGNLSETGTLQAMVQTVLNRFPVPRVILVAVRGLLSLENITELVGITDQGGRNLEFFFAVPVRRYADLLPTFRNLNFDEAGFAEGTFADHRLIVTHSPLRAKAQSERRQSKIAELEELAVTMAARLDAQDEGETVRGRRDSDREAHSHFAHAVSKARLTRFIKTDLQVERFSWFVDEDAISNAELFDGKLALLTNVKDLTPSENGVSRYKARADIKRGFPIPKSDIEIAPPHHRHTIASPSAYVRKLSMPIEHPTRRAYDYAFTHQRDPWLVIISFEDGTVVYGYFGENLSLRMIPIVVIFSLSGYMMWMQMVNGWK